jgi:hypothetical protein
MIRKSHWGPLFLHGIIVEYGMYKHQNHKPVNHQLRMIKSLQQS